MLKRYVYKESSVNNKKGKTEVLQLLSQQCDCQEPNSALPCKCKPMFSMAHKKLKRVIHIYGRKVAQEVSLFDLFTGLLYFLLFSILLLIGYTNPVERD